MLYRSPVIFYTIHPSGKQVLDNDGVEGSSHGLAIVGSVSEALHYAQDVFGEDCVAELYDRDIAPAITRSYDMTPSRVHFGRLQSQIMPVARYAVQNTDGIWKAVSYHEFVKKYPKIKFPRSGIIDIMAAGASMVHMDPSDGMLRGMRLFCRPVICASSSASCT